MSTYWLCCKCGNASYGPGGWHCDYYDKWIDGTEDGYGCSGWSSGGSKSRSSGCFLTTACVKHMGKPDNCTELETLRKFRDEYMANTEEGLNLIKKYYVVAPQIVQKIDSSNNKNGYYNGIYSTICKCVDLIKQNKLNETMQEYKNMVLSLQNEFSIA